MSQSRADAMLELSLGNNGSKEITGTSEVTADNIFIAIQFIDDSIVASQTDAGVANADLSAFSLIIGGTIVYGKWSSLTLTSGFAIGYNG
jgi:hypothetical protein